MKQINWSLWIILTGYSRQMGDPSARALLDSLINRLPTSDRARLRPCCYQLIAATTTLELPASSAPVSQSAVTLPIESCPLLAMRFLPTDFPLALLQANTTHGHQTTVLPRYFQFGQPTIPTPPGSPPLPLLLCLPLFGLWQ